MFLILLYLIFMYDLLLKTDSLEILTMKYIRPSKKKIPYTCSNISSILFDFNTN